MKTSIGKNNFVSCSEVNSNTNLEESEYQGMSVDPFKDINSEVGERFVKLDDVVFAEPISTATVDDYPENSEETQICLIDDNVSVEKNRDKKYKKYQINLSDNEEPICPKTDCQKQFAKMTLLKAHIRKVHCSESVHVCEKCGDRFKAEYLLRRHAATHGGARVSCPVCRKALSQRTNLAQHLRSHSDTRPHQCEVCDKRFLRKSTLQVHIKFVHREQKLMCQKCDIRFSSRADWSKHSQNHS